MHTDLRRGNIHVPSLNFIDNMPWKIYRLHWFGQGSERLTEEVDWERRKDSSSTPAAGKWPVDVW